MVVNDFLTNNINAFVDGLGQESKLVPAELRALIPQDLRDKATAAGLYGEAPGAPNVFEVNLQDFVANIGQWAVAHIDLIFEILRVVRPVPLLQSLRVGMILRYEDVLDALTQDNVFGTTNLKQLTEVAGNPFILGMANTPDYARDHTNLRAAIRRSDIPTRVQKYAHDAASAVIAAAGGSLEIVGGLTRKVPALWVGDYFGTPGPTPEELIDWCVAIFNFLTIPPGTSPDQEQAGLEAGQQFQAYVAQVIDDRKDAPTRDDVVGRLLGLQASTDLPGLDDDLIKSNIVGMVSGAIPPMATMAAVVMDELLQRPEQLAGAQQAAREGNAALVGRYVDEAMRHRPIGPGVLRITHADYTVGRGRWYETTVPKGTTLLIATRSAMFDRHHLAAPSEFRIDRDHYNTMVYGAGIHSCFGRYIASALLPQMMMPLLTQKNLRRAQGDAGTLTMAGIQAASLTLEWSPSS